MSWIDSTLASLTLEQKVGQLFVADLIATYAHRESPSFQLALELVRRYHVGGFVLAGGTVSDIALTTNALQRESHVPLLINGDLEGGLLFTHPYRWVRGRGPELPRFTQGGGTPFPSQMGIGATGDPRYAYEFGRIVARESRAVGIHWTNAPVADVNSNPNNPIINTRSFGEDPHLVASMVEACVRGLQDGGMIATLKHFPGHGDTEEDTHMKLPLMPFDRARLETVELIPFRAGIAAGVKAVMTAHLSLPRLDPVKRPATLSPVIITELLRSSLGFDGIVITDGMTMQGVTDHFAADEAAILAIEAGADVVLVPEDFARAHTGVMKAVRSGRISIGRLEESVRRVLEAKVWVGLDRAREVEVEKISRVVASPESESVSDIIFQAATTLLRNEGRILPLKKGARVHVVAVSRESSPLTGSELVRVLEPYVRSVALTRLSDETGVETVRRTIRRFSDADVVVLAVYLSVGSWKGRQGFGSTTQEFLKSVGRMRKPVVTVAFGDPYVLGELPPTPVVLTPYTGSEKAEQVVARALVGRAAMGGKLPVTIPARYRRGEGISYSPTSSE